MSKVLFFPEISTSLSAKLDKVAGALRVDGATHLVLNFPLQWAFKLNYSMRPIYRGTFMESCCIIFNCMIHWQNAFKSSSHLNLFYFPPLFSFVLPEALFGIFISWHKQAATPVLRRFREMMAVCETVWVVFYQFDHFSIDCMSIILWICVMRYSIVAFLFASGELRPASCL